MAATVRDFSGAVVGAIGFSGPVWRMSLADMAKYTSVTRSIAAELSEQFGFRPDEVRTDKRPTKNRRSKAHGNA